MRGPFRFLHARRSPRRTSGPRSTRQLLLEALEPRLAPAIAQSTITPGSVTFAAFGDYGSAGSTELSVSNLVHSWNPNFIVTLGDNQEDTNSPTTSIYDQDVGQYYHDFLYPYNGAYGSGSATGTNRFFPTLGDHDWGDTYPNPTGDQAYLSYFNPPGNGRYYDFVEGPVEFFMLSGDLNEPDGIYSNSTQAAWLQAQLAQSTSPWKIVVAPMSPYSAGDQGSWTQMQWPFQQWGASLVLSGHNHDYERIIQNGLTYVVAGTGGVSEQVFPNVTSNGGIISSYNGQSGLYPGTQSAYNADFGALQFTATYTQLTGQFITEAGTLIDSFTLNYSLPTAPSNLAVTQVASNQVGLTWTDNPSNETGYNILRSTDGTNFTAIATVGKGVTSYVDSGLAGGNYYYYVAAFNGSGSNPSNVASLAITPPTMAPDAPARLGTTPSGSGQVNLTWSDNSGGVDSFNIMRSPDGSNYTQIATASPGVTSYTDTGLSAGTYYYRIDAINPAAGSTSPAFGADSTAVVSAVLAPLAASNLTATAASATQVNLSWTDNATNEAGYSILRSTDGVHYTQVATVGSKISSYADTSASPLTSYYYEVSAYNAGGSALSSSASATTPTTPPEPAGNVSATAVSSSQVNITWTAPTSGPAPTSYKILYSTNGISYNWGWTAAAGVTSYSATYGLSGSTTYYFDVKATDAAGDSILTTPSIATTLAPPAAPSNLTATAINSTQINLAWTSNTGGTETGFKIYYSTTGAAGSYSWGWTTGTNVTTLAASGLNPSTTYYFEVLDYSSAGNSSYTNVASATTLTPPAAPSNLTGTVVNANQVNLTWTSNSGGTETGFKIYYSTTGAAGSYSWGWTTATNVTTLAASGLTGGTTYYFEVKAYKTNVGDGSFSNVISATTPAPPAAPSNLTGTVVSATQINLSWTSNTGGTETGFKIYYSTTGATGSYAWGWTNGSGVTTLAASGLAAATTYYFEVLAYNSIGNGYFSNVATATTMTLPTPPFNLTALAASSSRINLSWVDTSNNPAASQYRIYYSTNGTSFSWGWTNNVGVTTLAATGLSSGTTYYFQIKSYTSPNGTSAASNTASATTNGSSAPTSAPAAPSGLTATVASSSQINLTWTNNATNQNGFVIQRSPDGSTWTTISTVAAGITLYSDKGLAASTTYYYQVDAYNTVGSSAYSSSANTTTSAAGGGGGNHLITGNATAEAEAVISGVGQASGWSATLGAPAQIGVYVDSGLSSDEQARVADDIATIDSATWTGTVGLYLYEVSDPSQAGIVVQDADTTLDGGMSAGLLGDTEITARPDVSSSGYTLDDGNTYVQFDGMVVVNIVQGWNWYDGADPTQIGSNQFDYETVVLHELGHAIGLYHDTTNYPGLNDGFSVMYPELDPGVVRREFSPYDIAWLNHLYAYGADPGTNGAPEGVSDGLHLTGFVDPDDLAQPGYLSFQQAWIAEHDHVPAEHGAVPPLAAAIEPAPTLAPGAVETSAALTPVGALAPPVASLTGSSGLPAAPAGQGGLAILIGLSGETVSSVSRGSVTVVSPPSAELSPPAPVPVSVGTPAPSGLGDSGWAGDSDVSLTAEPSADGDAAPAAPAVAPAPADGSAPSPVPDFQASAAWWRTACTTVFAEHSSRTQGRHSAASDAAAGQVAEWDSAASLSVLLVLGGFWGVRTREAEERRRKLRLRRADGRVR